MVFRSFVGPETINYFDTFYSTETNDFDLRKYCDQSKITTCYAGKYKPDKKKKIVELILWSAGC